MDSPAPLVFALYREGMKMEAREYSEVADLHMLPTMKWEVYSAFKDRYRRMIDPEKVRELPPRPGGPMIEAGSSDAMALMRSVGVAMHHAHGFSSAPHANGPHSMRKRGRR